MPQPTSRENEPSAFAWIFGSVLGLLGAGAVVAGAALRRRQPGRGADERAVPRDARMDS